MSIKDNTSVLHALRTIEAASNEALQPYDAEVRAVFHKLGGLVAQNTPLIDQNEPLHNQPHAPESSIRKVPI